MYVKRLPIMPSATDNIIAMASEFCLNARQVMHEIVDQLGTLTFEGFVHVEHEILQVKEGPLAGNDELAMVGSLCGRYRSLVVLFVSRAHRSVLQIAIVSGGNIDASSAACNAVTLFVRAAREHA